MLLLLLFAFVAGAGTALSPCSLPVLPALLSASATGGRRRPLGIVLGLSVTFTLTIVGLAEVVEGVGLGTSLTRDVAIAALLLFGVALLVPALGRRLEAPLSRLSRLGPKGAGDGFRSGLAVGAALGFVHAPCAGPVLAAVIAVSAASGSTVALGIAFSLGTAATLLVIANRPSPGRARRGRPRLAAAPARARRGARAHRTGDGPQRRRALPAVPGHLAAGLRHQPDQRAGALRRSRGPPGRAARRPALRPRRARPRGGASPGGRRSAAAGARPRARVHSHHALAERPAGLRRPPDRAQPGHADRLLDLHLHQLPPYRPLPQGLEHALRRQGPHDRRRSRARVRLREEDGQRAGGDHPPRPRVPRRAGQRDGDLGRLGQPVLAREVPHRRPRERPLRALRRGRLHGDRAGDQGAAGRGGPDGAGRRRGAAGRRRGPLHGGDPGDLPRRGARRGLHHPAGRGHQELPAGPRPPPAPPRRPTWPERRPS